MSHRFRFPDPARGGSAALELVASLRAERNLSRTGVHAGPVVERDLDLYGRTVNLSSRIAEAAGPGEVLVSEEVTTAVETPGLRFELADRAALKGISEPRALFRVVVDGDRR